MVVMCIMILQPEESEWDEFGNDLYSIPLVHHAQPIAPIVDVSPVDRVDEDSKIKALVDTPALDWNRTSSPQQEADHGSPPVFRLWKEVDLLPFIDRVPSSSAPFKCGVPGDVRAPPAKALSSGDLVPLLCTPPSSQLCHGACSVGQALQPQRPSSQICHRNTFQSLLLSFLRSCLPAIWRS
ncbi:hypothetical protein KSP39_PZI007442 [Platanthera zijinensis]|uniref:Uncharacterized protein n=1 Tax=Platanthera zijinensis TaxID=2320716 RepID=A0AAP0G9S3_9ASPA